MNKPYFVVAFSKITFCLLLFIILSGMSCYFPSYLDFAADAATFQQKCKYLSRADYPEEERNSPYDLVILDVWSKADAKYGFCYPEIVSFNNGLRPLEFETENLGDQYHVQYYFPLIGGNPIYQMRCRYDDIHGPEYVSATFQIKITGEGDSKTCEITKVNERNGFKG